MKSLPVSVTDKSHLVGMDSNLLFNSVFLWLTPNEALSGETKRIVLEALSLRNIRTEKGRPDGAPFFCENMS